MNLWTAAKFVSHGCVISFVISEVHNVPGSLYGSACRGLFPWTRGTGFQQS
jgi:hypothetical protein